MVDYRTFFHATLHRRSFTTYKSRNFSVLKMENYDKSKVVGVRDVKVVTNLGQNLILKNVRHVLDLTMNLMLAGDLDDKCYASKFAKGA